MTIEDLKDYKQIRTPDMAMLGDCITAAKGPSRTMAQFAEETQISASTLSRIVNGIAKKPLSIDVIKKIYENRDPSTGVYLLDSLARANGMHPPDYAEKVLSGEGFYMKANERVNRENLMKNALIAGVIMSGINIERVFNYTHYRRNETPIIYPSKLGDFCFKINTDSVDGLIDTWAFYLVSDVLDSDKSTQKNEISRNLKFIFDRINYWFVLDAWDPQELNGLKLSFAFIDKNLHDAFLKELQIANVNHEMSAILMDTHDYSVIEETWLPGRYERMSGSSIFFENPDNNDYRKFGGPSSIGSDYDL